MDGRNDKPIPPWEQEQAAAALAELKQDTATDHVEQAALKVADSELLIAEVDRMIAEKRADLARMERLSGGTGRVNVRGLALNEIAKPWAIIVLLLTIVAIGIALHWMAGQIKDSIAKLPAKTAPAQAAPPIDFTNPDNDADSLKNAGVDSKSAEQDAQDGQQSGDTPDHPSMP